MILRIAFTFAATFVSLYSISFASEPAPPRQLAGHVGRVHALTFSPNGKYLASAGKDETVRVWDAATGKLLHTLSEHQGEVFSVAFRPDSYLLASGGARHKTAGEVIIWRVSDATDRLFKRYEYPAAVTRLAYGPKNAFAVGCADGRVEHRYTCTGKVISSGRPSEDEIRFVGLLSDGAVVASAGGHQPLLWNVTAGTDIASYKSHSFAARHIALSPDGQSVALAGVNELKLWDAERGVLKFAAEGIHGHTAAIAFTPDGKKVVTGGMNCHARENNGQRRVELDVWDVATGAHLGYFPEQVHSVCALAISPDGKTLATAGWHDTIALWNMASALPATAVKP